MTYEHQKVWVRTPIATSGFVSSEIAHATHTSTSRTTGTGANKRSPILTILMLVGFRCVHRADEEGKHGGNNHS